jgi:hypothetical protein
MNTKKTNIVQLVFELLKDSQYFLKEAEKHHSNQMLQQRLIRHVRILRKLFLISGFMALGFY